MDLTRLLTFATSFFLVSLSPGLCMTLAMSLGISIGVRRTGWMMVGELAGLVLVGASAVIGVAALLLKAPTVFAALKWLGGAYLLYMAWQSWRAEPLHPDQLVVGNRRTNFSLIVQGFVTSAANPKAWAFFVALLPPFVDKSQPLAPQLFALLGVILLIEFTCLQIYARGGRALSEQLHRRGKARWLNRVASILMAGIGVWLAVG